MQNTAQLCLAIVLKVVFFTQFFYDVQILIRDLQAKL